MSVRRKLWIELFWYILVSLSASFLLISNASQYYTNGTLINLIASIFLFLIMVHNTERIEKTWRQL